jgi:hypothetical protein
LRSYCPVQFNLTVMVPWSWSPTISAYFRLESLLSWDPCWSHPFPGAFSSSTCPVVCFSAFMASSDPTTTGDLSKPLGAHFGSLLQAVGLFPACTLLEDWECELLVLPSSLALLNGAAASSVLWRALHIQVSTALSSSLLSGPQLTEQPLIPLPSHCVGSLVLFCIFLGRWHFNSNQFRGINCISDYIF